RRHGDRRRHAHAVPPRPLPGPGPDQAAGSRQRGRRRALHARDAPRLGGRRGPGAAGGRDVVALTLGRGLAPRRASPGARHPAVFLDKDGTLVENVPYNVDPALLRFTGGAIDGLRLLAAAGYRLFVVSNQPGIALGRFDAAALARLRDALDDRLRDH